MPLAVLTFKLSDGTTQAYNVPATSTPDLEIQHIRQNGGFWINEAKRSGSGPSDGAVADVFINWEQIVKATRS